MRRFIVGAIILLVVVVACAGLVWFNFFRQGMIAQYFAHFPVPTVTVSTVEVKPQTWTPGVDAIGTISASQGVDVAGQIAGVVASVDFKANDKVAAGQVLVQIEDSVQQAGLAAAQSSVAVNQDALDRTQALYDKHVATSADLQAAQNKLDLAKGALAALQARLAQSAIKAPFSGTIGIPKVDLGQYIQAGTTVATLQDLTRMRVDFTVPEQELSELSLGQAVSLGLTQDHLDYSGAITGIDPRIDPVSRLVSVQAVVDNDDGKLRPGQFARVRVHLPEEPNVIALPQTAVVISLYGSYVYQVVPATAKKPAEGSGQPAGGTAPAASATPEKPELVAKQIFVTTGRRSDTQIEILKGVEPGMQIVSSGQNKLSNGSHVVVDNSVNPADGPLASAELGAMSFSEIFIRRPVLSTVVSLLILLLGAQGITGMSIRQYPKVNETVITVTTAYPGASADVIQGFITSTIAKAVSSAEGVDYVTSKSALGLSTVSVHMRLNANPNKSLTEVIAKVQQVRGQLPSDAKDPVIQKGTGFSFALMYLAARSDNMNPQQLTEYLTRVIQPRFATVDGVADAQILGAQEFRHAHLDRPGRAGCARRDRHRRPQCHQERQLPVGARQHQERVLRLFDRGARRRFRPPRPLRSCPSAANGDRSCDCGTWPRSSLPPPPPTRVCGSTASEGVFLGIFPTPRGQPARRRDGRAQGARVDPGRDAAGHADHAPLRFDAGDQRLDRRSAEDDRRGGRPSSSWSSCSSSARSGRSSCRSSPSRSRWSASAS